MAIIKGFLIIALCAAGSRAFTAYDCYDPRANFTTLSLLAPEPCTSIPKNYAGKKMGRIQILQGAEKLHVKAVQCKVVRTTKVIPCGRVSAIGGGGVTYAFRTTAYEQVVPILPETCQKAYDKRTITVGKETFTLEPGVTKTEPRITQGKVLPSGYCETEDSFVSANGETFVDSYEETLFRIEVRILTGRRDLADDMVVFPGAVRSGYGKKSLQDSELGTLVWKLEAHTCDQRLSSIYLGPAEIYPKINAATGKTQENDAIVIVREVKRGRFGGFLLRHQAKVCQRRCWITQIPQLVVCFLGPFEGPVIETTFKSGFLIDDLNQATREAFLHLDSNLQIDGQLEAISDTVCEVDRNLKLNMLADISGASNPHAMMGTYGPGHEIVKSGAVAYVIKCVPREAVVAKFPNCSQQIPVHIEAEDSNQENRTYHKDIQFVDPVTFNLQPIPTIVECSSLMPPRWKIKETWICSFPNVHECSPAETIPLRAPAYSRRLDFTQGLDYQAGIFDEDQRRANYLFQRNLNSREPVLAKMTNEALKRMQEGNPYPGMPLSHADLREVTSEVADLTMPWASIVGLSTWKVIGYLIGGFFLLNLTIGVLIRGWAVYHERGCGPWLLVACWETLYHLLMAPPRFLKAAVDQALGHYHDSRRPPGGPTAGAPPPYGKLQRLAVRLFVPKRRQEIPERGSAPEDPEWIDLQAPGSSNTLIRTTEALPPQSLDPEQATALIDAAVSAAANNRPQDSNYPSMTTQGAGTTFQLVPDRG